MKFFNILCPFILIALMAITGFGKEKLSYQQKDLGVGPVKKIKLEAINDALTKKGQNLFNQKCLVCHDLDQKKIGPPIRDVTISRTPEYILNLLLNTVQMQQQDSVVKKLIMVYKVPMPPPYLSQDDARAVLEYLRSVAK